MLSNVTSKNIGIVMHKIPDGDALGACCALIDIFKVKYPDKQVHVISDYEFSARFPKILPPLRKTKSIPQDTHIFIIDHNSREVSLLDDWKDSNIKEITIIDHHYRIYTASDINNTYDIEVNEFIDTNVKSTCELLFDYLSGVSPELITPEIATYLYIGIFSDSLYFSSPFTSSLIDKIHKLTFKYKAKVDDSAIYCYGKGFLYMMLTSRLWFRNVTKKKELKTALVTIDNKSNIKFKQYYITATAIAWDVLSTRNTYFVILKQEIAENKWVIKIASRIPGAIKQLFGAVHKDEIHSIYGVDTETVKVHEKLILEKIKKINEEYFKEEEIKYVPKENLEDI